LGDPALQSHKNKLLGFSERNSLHHENSARFAWQWDNDRLEIFAYCYADGVREEQFVGVVNLNEYNRYEIEVGIGQYIFRLNSNEPVYMKRGGTCTMGLYYKLWPYFGGSVPAPHTVHIVVKGID
jgi:RimJ/RimL family protein N-acetyltransferase